MPFEHVYTMTDYWDGPRGGIANFNGRPHVYKSVFDEIENDWLDTYLLMPIDDDTLKLALEDWEIWRRWETAFHSGETTADTHPALPAERARHEALTVLLKQRLDVDPNRSVLKRGRFRRRVDPLWNGKGWVPLEVEWLEGELQEHS